MSKRRPGRFELEWITISYRTLARWGVPILTILIVGIGALVWRHIDGVRETEQLLQTLDVLAEELDELRRDRPGESQLDGLELEIRSARERLTIPDRPGASAAARRARSLLERIRDEPAARARLLQVDGEVQVKRVGKLDWVDARDGMGLAEGDLVRTGGASGARYANLDGSMGTLGPNTLMKIAKSERDRDSGKTDVAVVVSAGRLTVSTQDLMPPGSVSEVKTPNLSASVESNTQVRVGFERETQRSELDVVEGQANVQTEGGTLALGASERLAISPTGVERGRIPGVPRLLSPQHNQVVLTRSMQERGLELEWESIRDARSYRVELGRTLLFSRPLSSWDSLPTNYVAVEGLPVGHYYWRVTAIDRDGTEGGPSEAGFFRISDAVPEGEPPQLEVTSVQALGEGVFLFEGATHPGVHLSIDHGNRVTAVDVEDDGKFRQIVQIMGDGVQTVTVTARDSQGLETTFERRLDIEHP